jgi:hypothetical protein
MNITGISNSISFSGIKGTATKINPDGSKTPITINLPENDAFLRIDSENSKDTSPTGQVKLLVNQKIPPKNLENPNIRYENVKIDKVDGNSNLSITAQDYFEIGTVKDNATMLIGPYTGLCKPQGATAAINKIEGENVTLKLGNRNSTVYINGQITVKVHSPGISCDNDAPATISGKDLQLHGW